MPVARQMAEINALGNWTSKLGRGFLVAQGEVRPSPLSRVYTIDIRYALKSPLKVRVRAPALDEIDGGEQQRPHTFPDGSLCLYRAKRGDWSYSDSIARYVIPWISEWLLFYEIWVATGSWEGGGEHPGARATESRMRVSSSLQRRTRRPRRSS